MCCLGCSQLVPNCLNHKGTLDSAVHRYPTHIRSPNYCHHMCIWQAIGTEKVAQIDVYTPGLEIRLVLCSQRVTNCCNDAGILDYALHRYPTHICSPNCSHRMCICQAIVIQKSLKLTFIHSGSGIDCFYALNLCETASMMWVFWSMLYTGTPHIFIRSPNYCHRMCFCQEKGTDKALKLTFIHSGSRFDWFYAVNVRQTARMMLVFWSML